MKWRAGKDVDSGLAATYLDLKQRGMLEDTLLLAEFWKGQILSGNFDPKKNLVRDHHPRALVFSMAGGGIKPGITYGGKR